MTEGNTVANDKPLARAGFRFTGVVGSRWHEVSWEGQPYPVQVRAKTSTRDGRLVLTGLKLAVTTDEEEGEADDGEVEKWEVTTRSIRRLPLTRILAAIAEWVDIDREARAAGFPTTGTLEAVDRPYFDRLGRPGPKGWPDEHYEKVAAAYRQAVARAPHAPVKELKKVMPASEPTLHRWLRKAEEMGLLEPTRRGEP